MYLIFRVNRKLLWRKFDANAKKDDARCVTLKNFNRYKKLNNMNF